MSSNVDESVINKLNENVELTIIRKMLGDVLYERVIDEINTVVTPEIDSLIRNYLKYVISWNVCSESLPHIFMKIREQGVVNLTGDTASSVNFDDFASLRNHINKFKDEWEIMMLEYLNNNITLYPQFNQSNYYTSRTPNNFSDTLFFSSTSRDSDNDYLKRDLFF